MPSHTDTLQWLADEYYGNTPASSPEMIHLREHVDLNGSHIETLDNPPTALEFSRLIHISRPVIIKGHHPLCQKCHMTDYVTGIKMPALEKWTNDYLIDKMGSRKISVAITPNG